MEFNTKQLLRVEYVSDSDTKLYEHGEIISGFSFFETKEFVKKYGHEKLIVCLSDVMRHVWSVADEIKNEELELDNVCDNNVNS